MAVVWRWDGTPAGRPNPGTIRGSIRRRAGDASRFPSPPHRRNTDHTSHRSAVLDTLPGPYSASVTRLKRKRRRRNPSEFGELRNTMCDVQYWLVTTQGSKRTVPIIPVALGRDGVNSRHNPKSNNWRTPWSSKPIFCGFKSR